MYKEMIIAGSGGQGVLVLGEVLAIANIRAGRKSTWLPAYGVTMRGGTCNCSVVLSDIEIGSPMVEEPQLLVCFNQLSFNKFAPMVVAGGLIVANSDDVSDYSAAPDGVTVVRVPALRKANELGNERCINMVMLGVLLRQEALTDIDTACEALCEIWGEKKAAKLLPLNRRALEAGYACT